MSESTEIITSEQVAESYAKVNATELVVSEQKKPTPEEQTNIALKAIEVQYKGLVAGSRLHIRTLLNMLTGQGIDGNLRKQIKDSIERALVAALDYGVDVNGEAPIRTHGALGKLESSFAMQMAKAKECGMVLMSHRLEESIKEEQAKAAEATTIAPTSDLTEQSNISKGE